MKNNYTRKRINKCQYISASAHLFINVRCYGNLFAAIEIKDVLLMYCLYYNMQYLAKFSVIMTIRPGNPVLSPVDYV